INSLPTEWSDIEILVANAGLSRGTDKIYEGRIEEIDEVIDTNVKGLIYTIKAVVPQMVQKNLPGIVITTGSVAGNAAYAGGAVYCASKAAVRYIADGLRIDTMDTRIRVTNIEPGMAETEFSIVRYRGDEAKAKNVYKGIEPLTGDDIAQTVAYICNLPENVQIPEIILTPNKQADALNKYIKK
ncbi:MAG: SDR family NAD(P)-dependent oxidoreductase, partial [Oscillospiraceae bacterium]|nr:SDR family NAD(P)-dependent oxidoreductase [Oscillospiraceae bacterium]